MANYKKITDVEVMSEVSENSMALVNDNGVLKQVSCAAGFGGGDFKTAIIKDVANYDNALAGVASVAAAALVPTYECINMTFEEAWQIMASGQPLIFINMHVYNGLPYIDMWVTAYANLANQFIRLYDLDDQMYDWSASGIKEYASSN